MALKIKANALQGFSLLHIKLRGFFRNHLSLTMASLLLVVFLLVGVFSVARYLQRRSQLENKHRETELVNKVNNLLKKQDYRSAEAILTDKKTPRNSTTLGLLAMTYSAQSNFPKAAKIYQQSLSSYPNDVNTILGLAEQERYQGDINHAIDHYQQAIVLLQATDTPQAKINLKNIQSLVANLKMSAR
ncbi:MAG: hypothetical protein NVS1B7_2580 [Candidatus Saccharimonadales bacterium]